MKKISLYATALLISGIGFTACDVDHNDLRLEPPTSYMLETPDNADQLMIFGIVNSNVDNKLPVVTHNPYNINTTVDFQVQVARSEADFQLWDEMVANQIAGGNDSGNYDFTNAEGLPIVVTISSIYTSPAFTMSGADFCGGINQLYGFVDDEAEGQVVPVAYRVHAWVPNVDYSSIFSNVVLLSKVETYNPLKEPKKIYLVGAPQGWSIDNDAMYVEETSVGSNIYEGKFTINAGDFMFRFYSELGDWDKNSIGSQAEDSPVDITFSEDNTYEGPVVVYDEAADILGKGSWNDPTWEGGTVDITLNMNDYTIAMVAHPGEVIEDKEDALYLIGAPQGWDINSGAMKATPISEGSMIYEGVFYINAGDFTFRFYSQLGDWENNSWGSLESGADEDFDITLPYSGGVYAGKGKWHDPNWEGGAIKVTIDLASGTIDITEFNELRKIYIVGACQGWDINNDAMYVEETSPASNVYKNSVNINSGEFTFRFYTALGDWEHNSIGSLESGADEDLAITVPYQGNVYPGKGKWADSSWTGGNVSITLDLNKNTVSFE